MAARKFGLEPDILRPFRRHFMQFVSDVRAGVTTEQSTKGLPHEFFAGIAGEFLKMPVEHLGFAIEVEDNKGIGTPFHYLQKKIIRVFQLFPRSGYSLEREPAIQQKAKEHAENRHYPGLQQKRQ